MNNNNFCVFDFETTASSPHIAQITQVAAVILNNKSLKIVDTFEAKMKPEDMSSIEDGALQVTGLTREQIADFPETSVIFPAFASWLLKHGKNNVYKAPIPMGYNILGYDMIILNRYCQKYKVGWDDKRQSQKLLSQVYSFDLLHHMWFWMESNQDIEKLKLTTILEYMGAEAEKIAGAHDALQDVKNTAEIIIRLFNMQRHMTALRDDNTRRLEMKGCMKK